MTDTTNHFPPPPPPPPLISVVVPCYNEEEVLGQTIEQLQAFAKALSRYRVEFIFVDDGSQDRTLDILRDSARQNSTFRILSFARNFGHQIALTAGIDAASGDAVALIDADLQDPPEMIAEMIKHWEGGVEVIYGVRASREGESAFKVSTARWFYRLLNRLSDTAIPLDTGDFRLMDRKVVDVLRQMPERHRFVRGLVAWVGYRQLALPYHRKKRVAGTSKYPLRRMLRFATDGILSFSLKPLQIATNPWDLCRHVGIAQHNICFSTSLDDEHMGGRLDSLNDCCAFFRRRATHIAWHHR